MIQEGKKNTKKRLLVLFEVCSEGLRLHLQQKGSTYLHTERTLLCCEQVFSSKQGTQRWGTCSAVGADGGTALKPQQNWKLVVPVHALSYHETGLPALLREEPEESCQLTRKLEKSSEVTFIPR